MPRRSLISVPLVDALHLAATHRADSTGVVRPYLHEDEETVSMHFEISAVQSRMRRDDPSALQLDYTRTMMGFLLFNPAPRSMLMIGLGGGSLPKYCHRHLPQADITVVENNPHVIAVRDTFRVPPESERFRVVLDDGESFVTRTNARFDVVLVDGFEYGGQPEALGTQDFYDRCRSVLTESGVLVVNLHAQDPQCPVCTARIGASFDQSLVSVDTEAKGNRVVFAGPAALIRLGAGEIRRRWAALGPVHQQTLRVGSSSITHQLRAAPRGEAPAPAL